MPDLSLRAFREYLSTFRPENTVKMYVIGAAKLCAFVKENQIDVHRNPGLLAEFAGWLADQGLAPSTMQSTVPAAKKYLEWRRSRGDRLPMFASPELPKRRRPLPVALRDAALVTFHSIVTQQKEPYRTALILMPLCGLRTNELCHLKLRQVLTEDNRFVLHNVTGKSKNPRDVPVVDPGSAYLYQYLTGWRSEWVMASPWLFPCVKPQKNWGKPLTDVALRSRLRRVAKTIGHPDLQLRHLRSTWVTLLVESGVEVTEVAQMAGHESIETTFRHYRAAATPERLAAAVKGVRGYR